MRKIALFFLASSLLLSCKNEKLPILAVVITAEITEITTTSAKSGGTITSDGNAEITDRGICWSMNPNPTTNDVKLSNGSGKGWFISDMTGLSGNTVYYVRAYAVNSEGTAYGKELKFTTERGGSETYDLLDLKPGTLEAAVKSLGYIDVHDLKLGGIMDKRDFAWIQSGMKSLKVLDIEDVTIAAYDNSPANTIPAYAFIYNTELTEVILPKNLVSIGKGAFIDCENLKGTLTVPENVKYIEANAFYGCINLTGSLVIPGGVETIGTGAFARCSGLNGTLTLPQSLKAIGKQAFYGCERLSGKLSIPEGIKTLENETFYNCEKIDELELPAGLTSIGENSFYFCTGFTGTLNLPASIKSIGKGAFAGCIGFTGGLIIPEKVVSIGEEAFRDCWGMDGMVSIPASVETIGGHAFNYCDNVTGFRVHWQTPIAYVGSYMLEKDKTVYVPTGTKPLYEAADGWKKHPIVEY